MAGRNPHSAQAVSDAPAGPRHPRDHRTADRRPDAKVELCHRALRGPGILARAGVEIAIASDHCCVPVQFPVHQATPAVKEGLDHETVLRAITADPAAILGLDDLVGTLGPGLDGDVMLWSDDLLDVMSRAARPPAAARSTGTRSDLYDRVRGVARAQDPRQLPGINPDVWTSCRA
ncbi:amidohydrolase family protein [Nonomuraea sp. CA-141351]|uniref:amidohydrolase family protein n=1 Tax=Nonomuraea sp. CA-141351 TaxID=3239996 RepID=UPI003D949511